MVTDEQLRAWFRKVNGRAPSSKEELAAFCVIEQTKMNPRLAEFGRALVQHAEAMGGAHLAYARARFAFYWGEYKLEATEKQANAALGISAAEGQRLFAELFAPTVAACSASQAYVNQPPGAPLNELTYEG